MNIIINGKQLEITPALRKYAEDKIGRFERYLSDINEAVITLSVEKFRQKAEVLLKAKGVLLQAEAVTDEVYSAIDEVVEKLEKQVVRHKEKLRSHRKGEQKSVSTVAAVDIETRRIIKHQRFGMKPMSPEEAVDQMELLEKDFFVFANQSNGDINVIYRLKDGNYGLIEPVK